ncbi:MAG: hypothetical protein ACREM2_11530 [Vulcanimicrobiaceae bacterium]
MRPSDKARNPAESVSVPAELEAFLAGFLVFLTLVLASPARPTQYNNYVYLASAFLHGHVWISNWPGPRIDALIFHGRPYIIEGPVPALLLLPGVALFGMDVDQQRLAALLAGVAVGAAWEIGRRLGLRPLENGVLALFLLIGTDLFWCADLGDVWFLAHVSAVAFTLLALRELLAARRAWLVGLFAVLAAGSRFSMILAIPIYALMLAFGTGLAGEAEPTGARRVRDGAQLGVVLAVTAALWIAYNVARWGVPADIGYTTWYHRDPVGFPSGSPFRLVYVPYELWSFFAQLPARIPVYPYLVPTLSGVALWLTSPALVLAFLARRPPRLVLAMWGATLLCAAPNVLYYVNGFAQFGMRHALDFEPYLFVLLVLVARERKRIVAAFGAVLIAWSALVGVWGVWFWRTFYRHNG